MWQRRVEVRQLRVAGWEVAPAFLGSLLPRTEHRVVDPDGGDGHALRGRRSEVVVVIRV